MLTGDLGNLSVAQLVERECEARLEHWRIEAALKARLVADCPLIRGHVYAFRPDLVDARGNPSWLRRRRMLVAYLHPGRRMGHEWQVQVHGFLDNPRSTTGDGFNRKVYTISGWGDLALDTGSPGPRSYQD